MSLELGESHLDWVEIGTVRRKEQEPSPALLQDRLRLFALVAGEIVENDNVAGLQGWAELGLDIGLKDRAVHRLVDDPGRGQAVAAQAGDEGLRSPVAEGRFGFQASADTSAPAKTGHLGGGAGLVKEDEPVGFLTQARLARCRPFMPGFVHIGTLDFGGQESFF